MLWLKSRRKKASCYESKSFGVEIDVKKHSLKYKKSSIYAVLREDMSSKHSLDFRRNAKFLRQLNYNLLQLRLHIRQRPEKIRLT